MAATTPKTKRVAFTKKLIESLKLPAIGRVYVYDSHTNGLCLCLTGGGSRSWYVYKKISGKPERILLGKWPEMSVDAARTEAAKRIGMIADGVNPNDKRRSSREAPTLSEAVEEFLAAPTRGKAKRQRAAKTAKEYRRIADVYLARWKTRKITSIRRQDVESLHNAIGDAHGECTANRTIALLKSVFNHAIELGQCSSNPCARLRGYEELSRERFLQTDELPKFWKALESEPLGDYFKLLLLTGARSGNVQSMRWEQLNLDHATWDIPTTKTKRPLKLPLAPQSVEILKARKAKATSDYVFPSRDGKSPLPTPKHAWKRILEASGLTNLHPHDLRRSLGSWQAAAGSSLTVIGKSLGHTSLAATAIYARLNLDPVRVSVDTATAAMLATVAAAEEKNNG